MIKLDQTYFTAAFKETVKCYIMSYNVKAGGKIKCPEGNGHTC